MENENRSRWEVIECYQPRRAMYAPPSGLYSRRGYQSPRGGRLVVEEEYDQYNRRTKFNVKREGMSIEEVKNALDDYESHYPTRKVNSDRLNRDNRRAEKRRESRLREEYEMERRRKYREEQEEKKKRWRF